MRTLPSRLAAAIALALLVAPVGTTGLSPAYADDAGLPAGKRVGPPDVPPLVIGKLRIEAPPWGRDHGLEQNGGFIAAYDRKSGKQVWTLKVYTTDYDPQMESDVQDVFIAKMQAKGHRLEITDEEGRRYLVNLTTRTVVRE